jgi:3-hydroxyacyl-CoA dehydrogenase
MGFYRYPKGKEPTPDRGVESLLAGSPEASEAEDGRHRAAPEEIRRRCLYSMVNEAARALEEQVVEGPGPVDLAMVTGTGFPPFRGGLLRWADQEGLATIHAKLAEYAGELGSRFTPAPLLGRMVEQNRTFTDPH